MAFGVFKIARFDVSIAALPDRITKSSSWLKRQFDARSDQIQDHFNRLCDALDSANLADKEWVKSLVPSMADGMSTQQLNFSATTVAPGAAVTVSMTNAHPAGWKMIAVCYANSNHPGVVCTGINFRAGNAGGTIDATFRNLQSESVTFTPNATVLLAKNNS